MPSYYNYLGYIGIATTEAIYKISKRIPKNVLLMQNMRLQLKAILKANPIYCSMIYAKKVIAWFSDLANTQNAALRTTLIYIRSINI
jgi:hypothetical protein